MPIIPKSAEQILQEFRFEFEPDSDSESKYGSSWVEEPADKIIEWLRPALASFLVYAASVAMPKLEFKGVNPIHATTLLAYSQDTKDYYRSLLSLAESINKTEDV